MMRSITWRSTWRSDVGAELGLAPLVVGGGLAASGAS